MTNRKIRVFSSVPYTEGWSTGHYLVDMCAKLLSTDDPKYLWEDTSVLQKLAGRFRPRKRNPHGDDVIYISHCTSSVQRISLIPGWRDQYRNVHVWILDSVWVERLPTVPLSHLFDKVYIALGGDLDEYKRITTTPVEWLPWGTDVLDLGSDSPDRPTDLQRYGRQPDNWKNDDELRGLCSDKGLTFKGRIPLSDDLLQQQVELMGDHLTKAKFVPAHSNLVDSSTHTHPTKEYFTSRWLDIIGSGAVALGVQPKSDPLFSEYLWPEAMVDLESTDIGLGMDVLQQSVQRWTPGLVKHNYKMALERLDWRLRFERIAKDFDAHSEPLEKELKRLRERIASLD